MKVKFKDNAPQALREADEAIEAALLAIGLQAEGYAKNELSNTPKRIDTGLLRNSITYAYTGKEAAIKNYHATKGKNRYKSGKNKGKRYSANSKNAGEVGVGFYSGQAPKTKDPSVFVGTNVEYAIYVHDGTQRMAANRFLRNAIERHANTFKAIVKKHLQQG